MRIGITLSTAATATGFLKEVPSRADDSSQTGLEIFGGGGWPWPAPDSIYNGLLNVMRNRVLGPPTAVWVFKFARSEDKAIKTPDKAPWGG